MTSAGVRPIPPVRPANAKGCGYFVCRNCLRISRDDGGEAARFIHCARCWDDPGVGKHDLLFRILNAHLPVEAYQQLQDELEALDGAG